MPNHNAEEQATTSKKRKRTAVQKRVDDKPESPQAEQPVQRGLRPVSAGNSVAQPEPPGPCPAVTLNVSVLHASLEHASYPVAIGHYDGDTIVGAEAALDSKLDKRLSQRRFMNLYPGKVGTAEVVLNPHGHVRGEVAGALVIGLGDVGEITPDTLTRGMAEAAVRLALARLDAFNAAQAAGTDQDPGSLPGRPLSAAFSALLIGTRGGRSLSIESAVAAIVAGAVLANRALAEGELLDKVCVDAVEFVEIYGDLATQATHALARINQFLRITPASNEVIQAEPFLKPGEGGYAGQPPGDYDASWWQRIQIKATADPGADGRGGELQFLLLTDRARAELTLQATQRALVEQLVDKTIHEPNANLDLPATLYELLLPNALKEQPLEASNLLLVVDAQAAQYPWEMMAERRLGAANVAGDPLLPLAVRVGMVRQLETGRFRAQVHAPHTKNALVIGEPLLEDPAYPALPGARAEAEAVAAVLESFHYAVTRCIQADALTIINALYAKEYRIIHIAGHGIYQPDRPAQSGVVLGKNIYLTAAEIGQLRVTPELVFLNCCYLGVIDAEAPAETTRQPGQRAWNKLAASVAEKLIEIGVHAVVAAGWAVDDRAAAQFAATLYRSMLSGAASQFGDAVRLARRAIYDSSRSSNTWGAYQCYGDPGFILQAGAGKAVAQPKRFVAQYEFLLELKNLQSRASRTRDKRWVTRYKNDLRELEDRLTHELPITWRNGELLAELGDTYAGLGAFEEAIAHYREALSASGPQEHVPLCTVEQLANLEALFAIQLQLAAERGEAQASALHADELMLQARKRIDLLIELAPTAERYALLASYHKRRAMARRTDEMERNAALAAAEEAYVNTLAQPTVTGRAYHTMSQIMCRHLRDLDFTEEDRKQTLAELAMVEEAVRREQAAEPSFWDRIVQPEAALLRALVSPVHSQIAQDEQALLAQYRRVVDFGATTRQVLAVLERLGFIVVILDAKGEADAATVVARMWKSLA